MKIVLTGITLAFLITCGTPTRPHSVARASDKYRSSRERSVLVSSGWMEEYKGMEKQFRYTIPADTSITAEGDHFRVSPEVISHFNDMKRSQSQ